MNRRKFLLSTCSVPLLGAEANIEFSREEGKIHVAADGRPFTTFHYGKQWDKPFVHPLRTASGIVVSRGFPVEKIPGESTDHVWHRGIFAGHGDINGADFWRELGREKTSRLAPKAEPRAETQGGRGRISVDLDMTTPAGKSLGTWREEFQFFRSGDNNVIDVRITVIADRGEALKLGDTEEGMFALRLHDAFRQDRGATLTNSDGLVGTENIWGKRARWVDYSTTLEGQAAGVAIFDHPKNPKHPTYWHARGYGLCAANAFGERDFLKDKTRDGSITIPAGGKLEFRYRVVIHPGGAKEAGVEKLYAAFSKGS